MARLLVSLAEASLSVIERITFEKDDPPEIETPREEKEERKREREEEEGENIDEKEAREKGEREGSLEGGNKLEPQGEREGGRQEIKEEVVGEEVVFHSGRGEREREVERDVLREDESNGSIYDEESENYSREVSGSNVSPVVYLTTNLKKVSVIGVGSIGMACIHTIVSQNLCDELAIVDCDPKKLQGEVLDLRRGASFLPRVNILSDTNYNVCAASDVCILTSDLTQQPGESYISFVKRCQSLVNSTIPSLVRFCPKAVFLVAGSPVDILTRVAWKLSGLPSSQVIGCGTNLDSSRLSSLIASELDVDGHDVHASVIGETGEFCVAVWSSVSVGGLPLNEFLSDEDLRRIHKQLVEESKNLIFFKGNSNFSYGYSVASILDSLLRDKKRIHSVSTLVDGFHGVEGEVFLSFPCRLGRGGVVGKMVHPLTFSESSQFRQSSEGQQNIINQIQ